MARKPWGRVIRISNDALQWKLRLGNVFGSRIGRRASLAVVSEKLGLHPGKMHRIKAHKLGGRPVELFGGLQSIGDEHPRDLYHEAFEEIPRNHVAILACSRENQTSMEPSAFLVALTPRLRDLVAAGIETGGRWRSQLATIREWEKERLNDWREAAARFEWLIGLLLFFLEGRGRRTAEAFGDLACALGALAAAYRIGGRLDDANDSLRLARPMVDLADLPLVEGLWFQKSGYLLVDLKRHDRAYEFFEEAALCFIAAGAHNEQAQALVDQGYVLCHATQYEAALKVLRRAVPLIAPEDFENRFAAHQLQVEALLRLKRYDEALVAIDQAFLVPAAFNLGKAALFWSRAKLLTSQQKPDAAIGDFESALVLQRRYGKVADVAELTCDYAELLIKQARAVELNRLVRETAEWAAEIQGHRAIRQSLENFVALGQRKMLDAGSLAKVRRDFPPTKKPAPRYRRRPTQPFGGKKLPASDSGLEAPLGGNPSPISGSPADAGSPLGGSSSPISGSPPGPTKNEIN